MDYRRVAELYDPRRRVGGTGYLIQSNLVLTAHHVIAPDGETATLGTPYDLRFIGDFEAGRTEWRTMGCHLCWDKPEYDLALLKLAEDALAFLRPKPSITLFGKLGGETLLAKGYGFPRVQVIEDRQNPEPLEGRLSRLAGLKEQQLRLQVTSPVPHRPEEWAGISGTSVFVEDCLVGVIIETNKSFAEKALWAVPISIVADDDEFRRFVLGARDAPLLFIELPRQDRLMSRVQTPPPPAYFITRLEAKAALLSFLLDQRESVSATSPVLAVHGMGGVGKSTMVAAVARDQDVLKAFPDGILWVEIKAEIDVLSILLGWVQELNDYDFRSTSPEVVSSHLRSLLHNKAV